MKPGPEMDALVAEKVMGLQTAPSSLLIRMFSRTSPEIPRYSTDIAAAYEVWLRLSKVNRTKWLILAYESGKHVVTNLHVDEVAFTDMDRDWLTEGDGHWFLAAADTMPHAICLAALRSVGVEVGSSEAPKPAWVQLLRKREVTSSSFGSD